MKCRFFGHRWYIATRKDFPRPDYPPAYLFESGIIVMCKRCRHWNVWSERVAATGKLVEG